MPSPSFEVRRALGEAPRRPRCRHARGPARWAFGLPILLCLGLPGLSGCSSLQDIGAYQEGWRRAEVVEVGGAKEIKSRAMTDCRASASAAELSSSRFALLSYRAGLRRHLHIVSVHDTTNLTRGDMVFTNVLRCGTTIEVLSPKPARGDGPSAALFI